MNLSQVIQAWLVTPILNELKKLEAKMTQLDDAIAALGAQNTAISNVITQLGTDVTAEIKRLQDAVASLKANGATPQNLADIAAVTSNLQGLVTTLGGLDTQATGA